MSYEILPSGGEDFENAFDLSGVRVTMFISEIDKVPVINIDTEGAGWGRVRISLNEGTIWDGNPDTHEHDRCDCVELLPDFIADKQS